MPSIPLALLLLLVPFAMASEVAPARSSLYAGLASEFGGIGTVRFVAGDSEDQVLDRLGGGEVVPVAGQPFARARRIDVKVEKTGNMWAAMSTTTSTQPVRKGELLVLTYYARGTKAKQLVDDGEGPVVCPLLWSKEPQHAYVSWTWPHQEISDEWQRYIVYSESTDTGVGGSPHDYAPGQLLVFFNLGVKSQQVEIGGVSVMAIAGADLAKLPKTQYDYPGRAPDAPWRAEAERRIEQHRKADLAVRVVDAAGKPVPGAQVRVAMQRHAFGFGTAVTNGPLLDLGEWAKDGAKYREILTTYFNRVVFENELKWAAQEWGDGFQIERTEQAARWLKAQGMRIRGHALIYGVPNFAKPLLGDREKLRATLDRHIADYVGRFRGLIEDWDVTNETASNTEFTDVLGPEAMLAWYRAARAADAQVKLTYLEPKFGDDGMEGGSFPKDKAPGHAGWVEYLVKNGAPLDYVAAQAHGGPMGSKRDGPQAVWALMDRMVATYGKRLQYTELDVNITRGNDPEALQYQADRLRDAMIVAFAHPAMDGITLWGFWERRHWFPNAALWRADWSIKPIGQAYVDLVTKRWWTDATVAADRAGRATVRGFKGTYRVTATVGGRTASAEATLGDGGGAVVVTLP